MLDQLVVLAATLFLFYLLLKMMAPCGGGEGKRRKLVIMDMNNVLVYRAFMHGLDEPGTPAGLKEVLSKATLLGRFYTWDRPGRRAFLDYCLDNFDVAVWSSAKHENVDLLCEHVFGLRRKELVFEWDQMACDVQEPRDPAEKPRFFKSLLRVQEAFGVNHWPEILMIDDSLAKMSGNPIDSYFIVDSWTPVETRDHVVHGLKPGSFLMRRLEQFLLSKKSGEGKQ